MTKLAQLKLKLQSLTTKKEKYEFLMRAQERFRRQHNLKGKDFRDGVVTEVEWTLYKEKFDRRNQRLSEFIGELREHVISVDYGLTPDPTNEADNEQYRLKKESFRSSPLSDVQLNNLWL